MHRTCSRAASRWCCSPRASARPAPSCSRCSTAPPTSRSKTGAPIMPVGIGGSERAMPKGAKFIYPQKLHVDHRRADPRAGRRETAQGASATAMQRRHRRAAHRAAAPVRPADAEPVGLRRRPAARRQAQVGEPALQRLRRPDGSGRTPHSSRAECMVSCGTPTSTVSMPSRVAVIGPMVLPHGMLLRLTNTCHGTPAVSHAALEHAPPCRATWRSAGCWLSLMAGPWFTSGRWPGSWRSG